MSAPTSRDIWPSCAAPSTRTMMRSESTESTTPERLQSTTAPESRAVTYSMPVPTYGASARSSGTAWRCMFDPISARLASSFSRNGIRLAATETSCFGLTSMNSISSRCFSTKLPACRALQSSLTMWPLSSISTFAWAMVYLSSSQAERYSQCASYSAGCFLRPACVWPSRYRRGARCRPPYNRVSPGLRILTSSITMPLITLRYGLSMKPYSLMRAKQDSDEIKPMFGPSGVSIGQMRP